MRRRVVFLSILIGSLIAIGMVWPRPTEAERVEADTVAAIRKSQLLRKNAVTSSPTFAAELILRHSKDPEGDYQKQFYDGMARLVELGVLEKRSFSLTNTTARAQLNTAATAGFSKDLLWELSWQTNGTVVVTAKPSEMIKWQKLIEGLARSENGMIAN